MSVHVFGIRHHGPGSARSLLAALGELAPDVVLVEGPPEAAGVLELAAHDEMQPPVALIVYPPEAPRLAVYYPFAVFSPEWQAIRWAASHGVPARFIDLPISHRFAEQLARAEQASSSDDSADSAESTDPPPDESDGDGTPSARETVDDVPSGDSVAAADRQDGMPDVPADVPTSAEGDAEAIRTDPLEWLGRASGDGDGERWWERVVETRRSADGVFAAILEAMTAVRDEVGGDDDVWERRREAHMRQQVRAAVKEGFERIAVACGAWHAPALARMPAAKDDAALLKGLPRAKAAAAWVPWTHGRLAYESGYGAGIHSPGWYEHLWLAGDAAPDRVAAGWLTRVARMLRAEDLHASPAQVVDAARLADSLAALRGLPLAGLPELTEACESVFWGGAGAGAAPLALIRERLIVGERLGAVPENAPLVPLAQDLAREQKRLRLPPEAAERVLELDLRKPNDLDRSRLLHRLVLLGIAWGADERTDARRKGTFHERWRLRWQPELAVSLIEAGAWGSTVAEAAGARARDAAERAPDLPALTAALDRVLLADLPDAARALVERIGSEAALASDATHLMAALPPLARTLRYGSVRGPDAELLGHVVDGLAARVCVGLSAAVASLDDDAAAVMVRHVEEVHGALTLLDDERHRADWTAALAGVAEQQGVHGRLAGRAVRLLMDAGTLSAAEASRRMGLALSPASGSDYGGAWIEGFLAGSATALLHDAALWGVLDAWISSLAPDAFTALLPLLRRTTSRFAAAERRALGELARRGVVAPASVAAETDRAVDCVRGDATLPLILLILGASSPATSRETEEATVEG